MNEEELWTLLKKIIKNKEIREDINPDTLIKARKLLNKVKIDYITPTKVCFLVESDGKQHFVIYFFNSGKWWCDCEYFSLKLRDCSHITAIKIKLNK